MRQFELNPSQSHSNVKEGRNRLSYEAPDERMEPTTIDNTKKFRWEHSRARVDSLKGSVTEELHRQRQDKSK